MNSHDPTQTVPVDGHERLHAFIRDRMRTPFEWGVQDCCLFAADAHLARIGVDVATDVRGTYSDALGAHRTLERIGGLDGAAARFGTRCPPLCASFGDVGIVNDGERDALGVCVGEFWLVTTKDGLGALPLTAAKAAWKA